RLVVTGLARGPLEGFRRRMQVARAVVDDRDGHDRASGCGNSPTMSDEGGRPKGEAGVRGGSERLSSRSRATQPSKKRRSALSPPPRPSRSAPPALPGAPPPRRRGGATPPGEASRGRGPPPPGPPTNDSSNPPQRRARRATPSRATPRARPPISRK